MTPPILKRLIQQLQAKGYGPKAARAIATHSLQESGNLQEGSTKPTKQGIRRGKMTAGERAKDRAAKYSGNKPSEYKYNKRTNLATKKGK